MNNTPLKAIKQFCYECCGENRSEVRGCTSTTCALKPFRLGKNPYIKHKGLSEEQKELARQRLADARTRKKADEVMTNDTRRDNADVAREKRPVAD